MDAAASISSVQAVQQALATMMTLGLTAYLYPLPATVTDGEKFDFIVIGGGTAGCVVARRLAEDGYTKVLVIEAGGDPPMFADLPKFILYFQQTSLDWNFTSISPGCLKGCRRENTFNIPTAKVLGGSSSYGYLFYGEGAHDDYDSWAVAANDTRWNSTNILPYLTKSQTLRDTAIENSPDGKLFGKKGPIILTKEHWPIVKDILNGFKELGNPILEDVNIDKTLGYTTGMFMLGNGVRQNTALKYLSPIKHYKNLKVLKDTLAIEIIFDKKKRAVAVRIIDQNNNILVVKATKEIIVSAGAVNTPKLLMLSGIGPKNHLKSKGINVIADLPVGKNFQDHRATPLIFNMKSSGRKTEPDDPHRFPAAFVNGYVSLNESKDEPDYQALNFINTADVFAPYCSHIHRINNGTCDTFFAPCGKSTDQTKNLMMFSFINHLHPKCRGEVLLRSCKYYDPPLIKFPYCSHDEDLDLEVKFIEDYMKVTKTDAFKKMNAVWVDPQLMQCVDYRTESTKYWKCYARCLKASLHDYCGTCALGSVVDGKLQVKGVKGLRVADASIIPTVPSSEIHGATIMVGEEAANIIKKHHKL